MGPFLSATLWPICFFLLKGLSTQGGRRGRFVCRVGVYEERHCFKVLVCLSVSSFVEGKSVSIEIILQLI